jgi:hypothetical protein
MISFKPDLEILWFQLVGAASALLGIPDFVLQAAAQWIQTGCNVVLAALNLI